MKKKSQLHAPVEAISYLLEPSSIVEAVQMAAPDAAVTEEPKKKAKKVEEPVAEVVVEPVVEPVAEVVEEAAVEPAAE
jgi:hypothetical protein